MRGALLLGALALVGGLATADERDPGPTREAVPPRDGLVEHPLRPAVETTEVPPNWAGNIPSLTRPGWVDEHLAGHELFLQPLVFPSVYPEVAIRLITVAGYHRQANALDLDQNVFVSFYAFEFYAPLMTLRDNVAVSAQSFRVNAKVPWVISEHNAVALFVGAELPVEGTLTNNGGFNTMFGYAYGSGVFSAQGRFGFGIDRLLVNALSPIQSSVLADAAIGVRVIDLVQLILESDLRKVVGDVTASIRLWPAVRLFPLGRESFSVGLGGMFWFQDGATGWNTERAGAVVDLGYVFL